MGIELGDSPFGDGDRDPLLGAMCEGVFQGMRRERKQPTSVKTRGPRLCITEAETIDLCRSFHFTKLVGLNIA